MSASGPGARRARTRPVSPAGPVGRPTPARSLARPPRGCAQSSRSIAAKWARPPAVDEVHPVGRGRLPLRSLRGAPGRCLQAGVCSPALHLVADSGRSGVGDVARAAGAARGSRRQAGVVLAHVGGSSAAPRALAGRLVRGRHGLVRLRRRAAPAAMTRRAHAGTTRGSWCGTRPSGRARAAPRSRYRMSASAERALPPRAASVHAVMRLR